MITMGDQDSVQRVFNTMQQMNALMCNTGTFAIDQEDDFTMQGYSFTGINDIYESFMLDISGAAEIPIDKLFGRSPQGFNSGEETLQNYYDMIQEKQETYVRPGLEKLIKIITMSSLGKIPDDLEIVFSPVRRPSNMEKADLGQKQTQPVLDAFQAGVIGKGTVLRELKQQTPVTNMWSNITDEMIEQADQEDEQKKQEEEQIKKELGDAALNANRNAEKGKENGNDFGSGSEDEQ